MSKVLVLNASYEPLNITGWRRAAILMLKGKAEQVEHSGKYLAKDFPLPTVIRLRHYVTVPYREIPLTRRNVLNRDNHTCQYCGHKGDSLTLDHVMPRSRGGPDTWENLIKKSPGLKLHVLFSGLLSVNSIALLNSPRFKRLIDRWKKEYDYVIFDTPPIVGVSDTRLIAKLVDGLVYIVSLNVAKRQTIERAIEIISSIQTPVLGLVINRAENQYQGHHDYYSYKEQPLEKYAIDDIDNIR